jgi:hypothetical protein
MQIRYEFPGITVVSADLHVHCNKHVLNIVLKNNDEEHEGYVEMNCTPLVTTIDRYYLQRWHQSCFHFDPLNYAKTLPYLKDKYGGQVLTKYCGHTQLIRVDNGTVVDYPLFKVDEDMAHAVETICQYYAHRLVPENVVKIQKHIRGYLSRRRYNFNKHRALVVKEIRALPPGAIVTSFPGGKDYLEIWRKWNGVGAMYMNYD